MKRSFSSLFVVMLVLVLLGSVCVNAKELVVYSYDSFGQKLMEMMEDYFAKEFNTKVRFVLFEDTGAMYSRLLIEKNKPVADVVIGLDEVYLVNVKADDLFTPYKPKAAAKIKDDLIFDPGFHMVPFDYGFVTFNYDSELLSTPPKTYSDLLKPEYAKKIVIPNPMTSSPGQAFLLSTVAYFGEDKYLDFWQELKNNILVMPSSWSIAYGIYTNGEAPLVLSYGTSPVYHLLYDKTERYQPLVLDNVAWAQIEGAGIVKGAKNLELAKAAIDYLLGLDMQEALPESQFMYPVRVDAKLPDSFSIAADTPELLNRRIELEKVQDNLEKWLNDWESVMR